jgi:hypothetical protein
MSLAGGATGGVDFEREIDDAVASLPRELRDDISNVAIVVEEEPPPGQPLLGLYQGIPLTRRTSGYSGVLPDKITIYRGPLERLYGAARSGTSCSTRLPTISASATSVSRRWVATRSPPAWPISLGKVSPPRDAARRKPLRRCAGGPADMRGSRHHRADSSA